MIIMFFQICHEFFEQMRPNHFKEQQEQQEQQEIRPTNIINRIIFNFIYLLSLFDKKTKNELKYEIY